ncbi:hypothetical protein pb186bvf_002505 [Paramecium bursaria]
MQPIFLTYDDLSKIFDVQSTPKHQSSLTDLLEPQTVKNEVSFAKSKCYIDVIDDMKRQLNSKDQLIMELQSQTRLSSLIEGDKYQELLKKQYDLIKQNQNLSKELEETKCELEMANKKVELYAKENSYLTEQKKQTQQKLKELMFSKSSRNSSQILNK